MLTVFDGMHEDIMSLILQDVHVSVVLNFLTTCKQFYAIRKNVLANNDMVCSFNKYDTVNYISAYFASDVIYDTKNMRMNIKLITKASDKAVVCNTYKMLAFNTAYNDCTTGVVMDNRRLLYEYYSRQMEERIYGYYSTHPKADKAITNLCRFLTYYNWAYTNIDMFDVCQCIYHIEFKNNRLLAEVFNSIQVRAPQDITTFYEICKTMTGYINDDYYLQFQKNKLLKGVLVCILYKFLEVTPIDFIHVKLQKVLADNGANLAEQANKLKGVPKYIKNMLTKQLNVVITKFINNAC